MEKERRSGWGTQCCRRGPSRRRPGQQAVVDGRSTSRSSGGQHRQWAPRPEKDGDLVCHANGGRGALGEFPVEDIFLKKKEGGGSAVRTPAAPAAAAEWASQHHRKRNLYVKVSISSGSSFMSILIVSSKIDSPLYQHVQPFQHGAVQGEVIDEEATQGQQAIVDASRSSCGQHDHHSTHRT